MKGCNISLWWHGLPAHETLLNCLQGLGARCPCHCILKLSSALLKKHLPDPFYLEGIERRSLRDAIFREVASNILIHREYASGVPARLIIEYGKVTTYNANRPHGFGVLNPETSTPFPKNPIIGAFFREIDRADELGSGMRKMMLYGKRYGGADPELIEGDVFRMIIKVPEFGGKAELSEETGQVGEQVTAVIDGKRVLGHPREIQEVRNAFAAYEDMEGWEPTS